MTIAVQSHRLAQMLELDGTQLDNHALMPKAHRKISRAVAVQRIPMIVVSLAVMKKREPRQDRRIDIQ